MKALIIIDMLKDFVIGSLKCDRSLKIVPNIKNLAEACRAKGIPVIYSNDLHLKGIDKELDIWGEHAIEGTEGAEVIPELKPKNGDYVVPKRRYSGFFATGLDLLLRELNVDEVILTGLHANLCVRHTAADAYFRNYRITVPEDGVEALSQKEYDEGIKYLRKFYGTRMVKTAELIDELE